MRSNLLLFPLLLGCPSSSKDDEKAIEICNGEDDDADGETDEGFDDIDGDGVANCIDESCDVELPAASTVTPLAECEGATASEVDDPWNVDVEWEYTDPGGGVIVLATIGEMTDDNDDGVVDEDDTPDIAVTTYSGTLLLLSGDDGTVLWELDGYNLYAGTLIADVDADGANEVVGMTTSYEVTAVNGDGEVEWTSEAFTLAEYYPQPVVGDLDQDGTAEIVFDAAVVSGADGSTLFQLDEPVSPYRTPIIADLDQDGSAEIILAENVYDATGTLLWSGPESSYGQFSVVVDTDGDAGGEVLFVTDVDAQLYDDDGTKLEEYAPGGLQFGVPCAADFDGDGEVEFGTPGSDTLTVFKADGTELWSNDINDISGLAGCSAFDFNLDGAYELLFADELAVQIFDGATGESLWETNDHGSGTVWEYPTVADVTGDGSADIVVASNSGGPYGITVYGQVDGTWPASGTSWPSHDWAYTNVLPDGSIPATPEASWSAYNVFRGRPSADQFASADLVVELVGSCVASCPEGPMTIGFVVSNQGAVDVAAGVTAELYAVAGDAEFLAGTVTLDAIPVGTQLAGQSIETVPSYFMGADGYLIRLGRTDGTGDSFRECDRTNNEVLGEETICGI